MRFRRPRIAASAVITVVGLALAYHFVGIPGTRPETPISTATSPTDDLMKEFAAEAHRACLCDRASGKDCWDKLTRITSPYKPSNLETASCSPIWEEGLCFGPSDTGKCVTIHYRVSGIPASTAAACTREEAQALERVYNDVVNRMSGPDSSNDQVVRALEAGEKALVVASKDMAAGRPVPRRATSPGCTG